MCRYVYYYFGACQHQHTVLLEFCEKARPLTAHDTKHSLEEGKNDGVELSRHAGDGHAEEEGAHGSVDSETTNPASSTYSTQASFDTGSTTHAIEPGIDSSSLQAEDYTAHSSTSNLQVATSEMAGLPLFGGNFIQWMSNTSSLTGRQSHVDASSEDSSERVSNDTIG